ncbi:MAG: hypothetical protein ACP5NV_01995 [Candidatus Woesearchaeota archaeon]
MNRITLQIIKLLRIIRFPKLMDKKIVLDRMDAYASKPNAFDYTPFGYTFKPAKTTLKDDFSKLKNSEFLSLDELFQINEPIYLQNNCSILLGIPLENVLSILNLNLNNITERNFNPDYKNVIVKSAYYSENELVNSSINGGASLIFYDASKEHYWMSFRGRVLADYFGFAENSFKTILTQAGFGLRVEKNSTFAKVLEHVQENHLPLFIGTSAKVPKAPSHTTDKFYTINL